jgi:hypothetical protein
LLRSAAFRVRELIADPPLVEIHPAGGPALGLILHGLPGRSYAVETTPSLDALPADWQLWGATGLMTNSFRFLPPFMPGENARSFRAEEQR